MRMFARMLQHTDLVVGVCTEPGQLVGFTRVLTDQVFKAVIFDVIVAREHRALDWQAAHRLRARSPDGH
jgi:hypothetical protein